MPNNSIHQFQNQFKLFNDFDGVAWHWYPLGAGSGDGVIPNVNDPKFLKDKIIPRLDEVELYYRTGFNALHCTSVNLKRPCAGL